MLPGTEVKRERRRDLAERDAWILARTGPDPELAGLAEHAADLPRALA
jgi:antitoxin MazE3